MIVMSLFFFELQNGAYRLHKGIKITGWWLKNEGQVQQSE